MREAGAIMRGAYASTSAVAQERAAPRHTQSPLLHPDSAAAEVPPAYLLYWYKKVQIRHTQSPLLHPDSAAAEVKQDQLLYWYKSTNTD